MLEQNKKVIKDSCFINLKTFYFQKFPVSAKELTILPTTVPEFKDPVFTKTSPKRSFSVIQNERFRLVFAKTGSVISQVYRVHLFERRCTKFIFDKCGWERWMKIDERIEGMISDHK